MPIGIYKRTPNMKTGKHMKGRIPVWKGKKHSKEHREKLSKIRKGKLVGAENKAWKENGYSYAAIHQWVYQWKGKPMFCEMCGSTDKKRYEWANIDHKYKRVLDDYIRLCVKCHRKYDKEKVTAEVNNGSKFRNV